MTLRSFLSLVIALVTAGSAAHAQLQGNVEQVWSGRSPYLTNDTFDQSAAAVTVGTTPENNQAVFVFGTWQASPSKWYLKMERYPMDPITGEVNHKADAQSFWPDAGLAGCTAKAMTIADPTDPTYARLYATAEMVDANGNIDVVTIAYKTNLKVVWATKFGDPVAPETPVGVVADYRQVSVAAKVWGGEPTQGGTGWDVQVLIMNVADGSYIYPTSSSRYATDDLEWPVAISLQGGGNVYVAGTSTDSDGYMKFLTLGYFTFFSNPNPLIYATKHGLNGRDLFATDGMVNGGFYVTGYAQTPGGPPFHASYFTMSIDPYTGLGLWTDLAATGYGVLWDGPDGGDDRAAKIVSTYHPFVPELEKYNFYVTGTSWSANTGNDIVTLRYTDRGSHADLIWDGRLDQGLPGYPILNFGYDDFPTALTVYNTGYSDTVYVSGARMKIGGLTDYVTVKHSWAYTSPNPPAWIALYPSDLNTARGDHLPASNIAVVPYPKYHPNVFVTGRSRFGTQDDFLTVRYRDLDP